MCSTVRAAGLLAALLLWGSAAAAAAAAPTRVFLVRPLPGDDLTHELTARMAGEIRAAGLAVDLREQTPGDEPDPGTSGGQQPPAAAGIAIGPVGPPPPATTKDAFDITIEVIVAGTVVHRAAVVRRQMTGAEAPRLLAAVAVRTVAVLQAALLERTAPATTQKQNEEKSSDATRPLASPTTVPVVTAKAPQMLRSSPSTPARPKVWSVSAAAAAIQTLRGVGTMVTPLASLGYAATPALAIGLRVAAAGTAATASAAAGRARVRQDLALLGIDYRFRLGKAVQPLVMAGAGACHIAVQGEGAAPYVGQSQDFWGAAADVGMALSIGISPRLALILESHVLWVWPRPLVRIDAVEVGAAGRPSLVHSAGLQWWL